MGKLYITGRAKEKLNADTVNINLKFRVTDKNSTNALNDVTEQCERFLGKLKETGFDLHKIRLEDDRVEIETYVSGKPYSAQRTIEFEMPFDIKSYNGLLDMIRKEQYEISISTRYFVSNIEEVKEKLIQEAVIDSQNRAIRVADAMGKKVIGCKEVNVDGARRMVNPKKSNVNNEIPPWMPGRGMDNSNQLGAPLIEEEKTVSVTWIIE